MQLGWGILFEAAQQGQMVFTHSSNRVCLASSKFPKLEGFSFVAI